MVKKVNHCSLKIPLNEVQISTISKFNSLVYEGKILIHERKECFCGSKEFETLSSYDRFCLPFGTQICKSCGLVSQKISISENSLKLFYDQIYWPLIRGVEKKNIYKNLFKTSPKKDESQSFILPYLLSQKKEDIKIFEVGCGEGLRVKKLVQELNKFGINNQAYGCDYSSEAIKNFEKTNIKVVFGGIESLEKFGKADVLILSHVFEHMNDLKKALEKIKKVIKIDGLVYIEVPGLIDLKNKVEYGYSYQNYNVLAHIYNFSLITLSNVMSSGGFTLIKGDEFIRSVFQIGTPQQTKSGYAQIKKALKESRAKEKSYEKRNSFFRYIKRLIKVILGRKGFL